MEKIDLIKNRSCPHGVSPISDCFICDDIEQEIKEKVEYYEYLWQKEKDATECYICHAKVRKDKKLIYQGKTCSKCDKRIDEIYAKVEEEFIEKERHEKSANIFYQRPEDYQNYVYCEGCDPDSKSEIHQCSNY